MSASAMATRGGLGGACLEDVGEASRERRSRQHLVGARRARRGNQLGVDVGRERRSSGRLDVAASAFSAAIVAIASIFWLFRSKITRVGWSDFACATISSVVAANVISMPRCLAVVADLGAEEEIVNRS